MNMTATHALEILHGRVRRVAVVIASAAALLTGVAVAAPGPAYAANSGTVMCADMENVVGVWVNVSGGVSGWAYRWGSGYSQGWSYNTQGKSYSLTVGCGGTPQSWRYSTKTPYYSYSWSNVTCFPGWAYGFGSIFVYNRCYAG